MAYTPVNFVNGVTTVQATWLNGVDQMVYNVLGGWQGQTVPLVQAALGIPSGGITFPISIAQGGTGEPTASAALAALGGLPLSTWTADFTAAGIGALIYPTSTAEATAISGVSGANTVVNPQYPPGYVDRYITNTGTSATDCAPGFNAAFQVARVLCTPVVYGPTAPYYLNSIINYTTSGGPAQNGITTMCVGSGVASDFANLQLIANHSLQAVFDCCGTANLAFYRVGITTASGRSPGVCWLMARNISGGGAGFQRLRDCFVIGSFATAIYYNYGAEDDLIDGCYFNNTATTPSTACIEVTANNAGSVTSIVSGGIVIGSQSTTEHVYRNNQTLNSAGTATSYCYYLESAVFVRILDGWWGCFSGSAGGEAYVGVNQANGPSNNVTIANMMGEQNGALVPSYGILFFNTAQQNVSWSVRNCLFPNTSLAISCNGTLNTCNFEDITEQPSTSHGMTAIAVTNSTLNTGALKLNITTSTNNSLTGDSANWTISNRVNDFWNDTGTTNKTWTPNVSGLTHTGAITVSGAKMLLFGSQCMVEFTMASSGSLTPTAGQTVTGLPFAPVANNSPVDIVDFTTPVALGTGVVVGNTLVMPAFTAGTHTVVVRATYSVA